MQISREKRTGSTIVESGSIDLWRMTKLERPSKPRDDRKSLSLSSFLSLVDTPGPQVESNQQYNTHTHTHTPTEREREREERGTDYDTFVCFFVLIGKRTRGGGVSSLLKERKERGGGMV